MLHYMHRDGVQNLGQFSIPGDLVIFPGQAIKIRDFPGKIGTDGHLKIATLFKPPPPVGAGGGCMFSGRPSVPLSVRACVRPSVRDSRGSFMFPRYLQYLLTDFRQTFVIGASWDTDDLITFLGQKVKIQGHTIAAEAHSTRLQLF